MSRNTRIEELSDTDSDLDIADISSITPSTPPPSASCNPTLIPANAIPTGSAHHPHHNTIMKKPLPSIFQLLENEAGMGGAKPARSHDLRRAHERWVAVSF